MDKSEFPISNRSIEQSRQGWAGHYSRFEHALNERSV